MADKALLLGINTYKSVGGLRGCLNDVENVRKLLTEEFGFASRSVKTLLDDKVKKADVLKQMDWLFQGAQAGDRVVFHYSGHGSYTTDLDGDETDGTDELLCFYDMDFNDPGSYLIDDEIRRWTEKKPDGVNLTVILDCCHSGTGTRLLIAPDEKGGKREIRVDANVSAMRGMAAAPGMRGLEVAEAAAALLDPNHDDVVRVRFIDPPPQIKAAIAKRKQPAKRALTRAAINHFLFAACKDDQTAADAVIAGTPNGAFSYYLCQASRELGASASRHALIGKVEASLQAENFDQVPQFEGQDDSGPMFGPSDKAKAPEPDAGVTDGADKPPVATSVPDRAASGNADAFRDLLAALRGMAPDVQRRLLDLYEQQFGRPPGGVPSRAVSNRVLVYVHGICTHTAGFSDEWWKSLRPFTQAFGEGVLGQQRQEVVWSDLVNRSRALTAQGATDEAASLAAQIRDALQDRVERQAASAGPADATRDLVIPRGISIPGMNCVDDFAVYMTDESVRQSIIDRFTAVVKPLLLGGSELDIIAHSWGTVVAYEGLRELADRDGVISTGVRNFFTVGAALSLGPVKFSLRPENKDGQRPAMVRRWVNLDARGDVVGGALKGRPYAVDVDRVSLEPVGCPSILGLVNPVCAHGSYFVKDNTAVNRDIFARFIDQA